MKDESKAKVHMYSKFYSANNSAKGSTDCKTNKNSSVKIATPFF